MTSHPDHSEHGGGLTMDADKNILINRYDDFNDHQKTLLALVLGLLTEDNFSAITKQLLTRHNGIISKKVTIPYQLQFLSESDGIIVGPETYEGLAHFPLTPLEEAFQPEWNLIKSTTRITVSGDESKHDAPLLYRIAHVVRLIMTLSYIIADIEMTSESMPEFSFGLMEDKAYYGTARFPIPYRTLALLEQHMQSARNSLSMSFLPVHASPKFRRH